MRFGRANGHVLLMYKTKKSPGCESRDSTGLYHVPA